MTHLEEIRKDPARNRIYLQEKAILDLTCEICKWMQHNCITKKRLAKKLNVSRKKLKHILAGQSKISLRMASDLCWALGIGAELKIGVELPRLVGEEE